MLSKKYNNCFLFNFIYSTIGEHRMVAKNHIKRLINEKVERMSNNKRKSCQANYLEAYKFKKYVSSKSELPWCLTQIWVSNNTR